MTDLSLQPKLWESSEPRSPPNPAMFSDVCLFVLVIFDIIPPHCKALKLFLESLSRSKNRNSLITASFRCLFMKKTFLDIFTRQVSYMSQSTKLSVNEVMEKNSHILLCYPSTHAALCTTMTQNVPVWTCLGVTARRGGRSLLFSQCKAMLARYNNGARTAQACGMELHWPKNYKLTKHLLSLL